MQGLVSAERNGYFANQLWQIEPIAVSHHKRHKRVALKSHWRQRLRKAILHRHKKGVGVSENAGKDFAGDEVRSSVLPQPVQNTSAAETDPSAERRVYGTRGSGIDGEGLSSRLLSGESCSGLQQSKVRGQSADRWNDR